MGMIALVLYCGFIFYLSHQPALPVVAVFMHQDKVFHATAYAVLAFLTLNSFKHGFSTRRPALLVSFIFCALYGASDEWHQSFIDGRHADSLDWLADCIGAVIMLLSLGMLKRSRLTNSRA